VNRILFIFAVFIAFCVCIGTISAAQKADIDPVIVFVDKGPSGFVTRVNSKIPSKGLLFTLSEIHDSGAAPNEAVLLVHEDVNFSRLINYLGIMRKAGYINPRIFFFSRNKDWMTEITKSGAMPFSVDKIQKGTESNKK
jgi:hypothetical protein